MNQTALILLSGGKGLRMKSSTPKQYLALGEKPIALHSFSKFCQMPFAQIVVVCEESVSSIFSNLHKNFAHPPQLSFAVPGKRRQDSVASGLQNVDKEADFICIHDAARPFVTQEMTKECCQKARKYGAAAVAIPVTSTLRRLKGGQVDRKDLYEMQTPQCLKKELLMEGLHLAEEKELTVTDDVSFAELLDKPVHLCSGSLQNLKITSPSDLEIASALYEL